MRYLAPTGLRRKLRLRRGVPKWVRPALIGLGIAAGVFVLFNLVLLAIFWGRTYPASRVAGQPLGSVSYGAVADKLAGMKLLPAEVAVAYQTSAQTYTPSDLGLELDSRGLTDDVHKRHWLPAWNLVSAVDTPLRLRVDSGKLDGVLAAIGEKHKSSPVDARIEQTGGAFTLVKMKKGSALDMAGSRAAVVTGVQRGHSDIKLDVRDVPPKVTDAKLAAPLKKLLAAQATPVTYTYATNKVTVKQADIVAWYHLSEGAYDISEPAVKAFLTNLGKQWGLRVTNTAQVIAATRSGLDSGEAVSFALEGTPYVAPSKTFSYCTAVRGVDAGQLPELQRKLASTYADERGWGLGGAVEYTYVTSGCDFTVWLSAAAQISTFGAICDSQWSCTVRPNVVLNFDRWTGASDAWNAAGGSLDDYRSMVINHESGHWLGFNHKFCAGAGNAAPVMQQQSIDLMGCTFNPWPLATERAELKGMLGI